MSAVAAEDIGVQPQDGGQVLGGRRAGRHGGGRARGAEVATDHLGAAGGLEAQLFVERLPVRCGVQRDRPVAQLRQNVPHQPPPHAQPCVLLGHQDHSDGGEIRVRGDHAGADQPFAVRVVDAVAPSRCEQQAPLVLLARPAAVLGEVGAGNEVVNGQAADRKLVER